MAVLLRTLSEALVAGQAHSIDPAEDQALSTVYRRRCRKSLKDAIKITRGLAASDFPFIDVVMAVSPPPSSAPRTKTADGRPFKGVLVPDYDHYGRVGSGGYREGV